MKQSQNFHPCGFAAILLASALVFSHSMIAQISIDDTYTPQQLVEDVLVGAGVQVSNVTFNLESGDDLNVQIGKFNGPSQFFDHNEGIAMVSGPAMSFESAYYMPMWSTITDDPDLWALINAGGTNHGAYDCAVLEFDFVPNFEFLAVEYLFASMEYPAYTCSPFNDVFGFFVSGPGITGPFSNNAVNIALIPYTDIGVGINSVNSGQPSFTHPEDNCLNVNPNYVQDSIYFQNNNPMAPDDIQFPGMTVGLTANIILQAGETYHIKLGVADAFDTAFDSGVLLAGSSFSAFPISSVDEMSKLAELSLFPNPAANILNMNIAVGENTMIDVRILNSAGQVVMLPLSNLMVAQNHFHQMDVSGLSSGMYMVELTNRATGEVTVKRFAK